MRLFIAISLPDEIRDNIHKSAKIMKRYAAKGSFPKAENYHITLSFLGEIEEDRIPLIRSIMDMCQVESFEISLEDIGRFRKKDGDVVHRRVESSRRLYNLQDKLARLLTKNGFEIEKRAFQPHITIGRRVQYNSIYGFSEIIDFDEMLGLFGEKFIARSMHLFLSEQGKNGRNYLSLYEVPFKEI
ncbi:MAG: RNA 2',3'-cyclic phosphodiesterase [Eubacteriales bacterium]|nr:RNA 2',3'-cyclic phosphodiesterase [Eubacteriales bacterium]